MLRLELAPFEVNGTNTLYTPPAGEIVFLMVPPFNEHYAPQRGDNGVQRAEVSEEGPGECPEGRWNGKKGEVGLGEGEVVGNLLSHAVADLVQVLELKEVLRAPL